MIRDPEFIPPEIEAKIHRMGNVIDWTSKMSEKKLMEALNSRSWDKVVFLREPLEKFKSAYTNKCGNISTTFENFILLTVYVPYF